MQDPILPPLTAVDRGIATILIRDVIYAMKDNHFGASAQLTELAEIFSYIPVAHIAVEVRYLYMTLLPLRAFEPRPETVFCR